MTLGNPTLTSDLKERLAAGITAETAGRGIAELAAWRDRFLVDRLALRAGLDCTSALAIRMTRPGSANAAAPDSPPQAVSRIPTLRPFSAFAPVDHGSFLSLIR